MRERDEREIKDESEIKKDIGKGMSDAGKNRESKESGSDARGKTGGRSGQRDQAGRDE